MSSGASKHPEQITTVGNHPVAILGEIDASGEFGSDTTGAAAGTITGLKPGGLYEFRFFDNANKVTGTPVNVYYRTGAGDAAVNTDPLWPASTNRIMQRRIRSDQSSMSFLSSDAATPVTVFISWSRLQ